MLTASPPSNGSPSAADDQRRRQLTLVPPPHPLAISDSLTESGLDIIDFSATSTGEKRKREGKVRSKVWQHFTKIIKEDGTCEKCQCNHCERLFTCASKCGTTHLLRHITDGICPVYKNERKDKSQTFYGYPRGSSEHKGSIRPWRHDQGLGQASAHHAVDVHDELLSVGLDDFDRQTCNPLDEYDYGVQASAPTAIRIHQTTPKSQRRAESWMNELRACAAKIVDLTNERVSKTDVFKISQAVNAPDYSLAAAVKCLDEMEDIPQSSEMYLDAFEIMKDAGERECFICLNCEPRRRWLQRMLHRRFPSRYSYDI